MTLRHSMQIENAISFTMLEETASNSDVQEALKSVSIVLMDRVLPPLREALSKADTLEDIAPEYRELIMSLAGEHTAEKRQYGALYPHIPSAKDLMPSVDHAKAFLDELENVLLRVDNIASADDAAIVMKTLVEFGYTYYEAPKELHGPQFEAIDLAVGTTREELDIRLFRTELGELPQYAITFGIETGENDLGLQSAGTGRNAGKSAFGKVSMEARLQWLCDRYDESPEERYAAKLRYYKIPLLKEEREPLEAYAARWKTWFEKYATDLPLVASVSRATTRLLVSLHDVGAFDAGSGDFDLEKAQIVANCVMGFIVHAGHHSVTEVAEVYNRLLDYAAISHLEEKGPSLLLIEENMPYYRPGNYSTFFNEQYRNRIMDVLPAVPEEKYDYCSPRPKS